MTLESQLVPKTLCLLSRREKNLLEVHIDDVPLTALLDTEAHISAMSSDLRHRLRKIFTPSTLRVVRVADRQMPAVDGLYTARGTIADHTLAAMFTVLHTCPVN